MNIVYSRVRRGLWLPLLLLLVPGLASATISVCVEVETKSWSADTDREQFVEEMETEDTAGDPFSIDPARYLGRMVQYEVTHEVGFEAVEANCTERLVIELYPLRSGWTVFARYSGHSREEKVDHVQLDEFISLAQRLTTALLRDKPISDIINRENVLRADSQSDLRTIDGEGHFVIGLGTRFRFAELATATSNSGPVEDELRVLTPLDFHLGYRGKYQAWGLDAFVRGTLGVSSRSPRRNTAGGHVDFEGAGAFGLHFLRYFDAKGVTSMYLGGGAQFQLSAFSVIKPAGSSGDEREDLFGGGLDVDLVIGCEFMRASSVHFYVQAEVHAPTYLIETEVDAGGIDAYMPGGLLQLGMVF